MSFTFTLVCACDLQQALALANEWKVKRMLFRKTRVLENHENEINLVILYETL